MKNVLLFLYSWPIYESISLVAIVQWVMCWLIRHKATVQNENMKKKQYFFGDFLSANF